MPVSDWNVRLNFWNWSDGGQKADIAGSGKVVAIIPFPYFWALEQENPLSRYISTTCYKHLKGVSNRQVLSLSSKFFITFTFHRDFRKENQAFCLKFLLHISFFCINMIFQLSIISPSLIYIALLMPSNFVNKVFLHEDFIIQQNCKSY